MHFTMLSAICFNFDQSKILSCGKELISLLENIYDFSQLKACADGKFYIPKLKRFEPEGNKDCRKKVKMKLTSIISFFHNVFKSRLTRVVAAEREFFMRQTCIVL